MLVGKALGPYVIDKELGSGAMGTVYRAKHNETGERVAVKLMSPALGANGQARARFEREFKILQQVRHPNIVRFIRSGRYHNAPFFIMEYVQGDSLDHVMARRDRLTWEEIVEMGTQLCSALQHAHDQGIIHRDLKPSNVMVLRDGTVKLTDFGIAKDTDVTALTAANSTVGTAAYMSPEQCKGARDITYKSDLYSLGVMFYELLTGRKPFHAETAIEMFMKHAKEKFAPPSQWVPECPPWLNTLICQLMEKQPDQRPLSADMVAKALALVKEKMLTQQSAGLDTAKKRRIDRAPTDVALDAVDKDAARAMLGKKKKKKKAAPFYTRGWFTIAALVAIVMVVVVGVYVLFIKPPSAESLYAQAEKLMSSTGEDEHKEARDGPLKDFLLYHSGDKKAAQVQTWADQVDREIAEKQMLKRRARGISTYISDEEKKAETRANDALEYEELGKLDDAAKAWQELLPYKTDKEHAEQRPWALIAEKYLKDIRDAERLPDDLNTSLRSEEIMGKEYHPKDEQEKIALKAMREEKAAKWSEARKEWAELERKTRDDPALRRWQLLAAKKVRELKEKN